jgi:hypothetical protein
MRRLECCRVGVRFMQGAHGATPNPAQKLPQHDSADPAEDGHRSALPDQGMHELAHLRIRHAENRSSFAA